MTQNYSLHSLLSAVSSLQLAVSTLHFPVSSVCLSVCVQQSSSLSDIVSRHLNLRNGAPGGPSADRMDESEWQWSVRSVLGAGPSSGLWVQLQVRVQVQDQRNCSTGHLLNFNLFMASFRGRHFTWPGQFRTIGRPGALG